MTEWKTSHLHGEQSEHDEAGAEDVWSRAGIPRPLKFLRSLPARVAATILVGNRDYNRAFI